MKQSFLKKILRTCIILVVVFVFVEFFGKRKLISGTVITKENIAYKADKLSIDHEYLKITVYKSPRIIKTNPLEKHIILPLNDVQSIMPESSPNGKPIVFEINGKKYIEILVLFKNNQQDYFIIDETTKVFCHQIENGLKEFDLKDLLEIKFF